MSYLDPATGTLHAKIVYFGETSAGKSTNLDHIHRRLRPELRGKMLRIGGEHGYHAQFFDFAPQHLPRIHDHPLRLHLYAFHAPPGPLDINEELYVKGVEAVVVVVDSRACRQDASVAAIERLGRVLAD